MIDSSYSASDVSTEELKPQAPEKFGVFDFTNDKLKTLVDDWTSVARKAKLNRTGSCKH